MLFDLGVVFGTFLFGLFSHVVDWSLDQAVPHLFAFPFVQLAHPVYFLYQLFVILDMAGRVLNILLLLSLLLKHCELQHSVLHIFLP